MKHLFLLLVLLTVTACAQQATQATDTLPQTIEEQEETSVPEPIVEDTTVYPTIFDGIPSDTQEIIRNGQARLEKGFSYTYQALDSKNAPLEGRYVGAKVYQKGDLVKLELAEPPGAIDEAMYVDTVYMNLADETIQAYCNDARNCNTAGATRTVAYEDFVFMKPNDWIDSMTGAKKIEERTIQNRMAVRLDGTVEGNPATIWVDRYSGLPVEASMGGNTYRYSQLGLGVTDDQIRP